MTEQLKFRGRLAEKELEAKKLRLRMEGLRDSIRELLDPFEPVAALRTDVAMEQVIELAGLNIDLKEAIETIAALKKILGA